MFRSPLAQHAPSAPKEEMRKKVVKQISRRNACAISASSVASLLATADSPRTIVGLSGQMVELRKWTLQTEVEILELLRSMDSFDRLETLFEMFDKDDSGEVSLSELESALQKVDFHQALRACILKALKNFDSRDGQMDFKAFSKFVGDFREEVGWTIEEVTEFLAIHVGFTDGSILLDEGVDMLLGNSSVSLCDDFNMAVMEVRLIYLFQMFDPLGKGLVEFEEVVKSLYGLTKDMDKITREVLMMCSSERRELSYDRFSQFIYDVVSAGGYNFDMIANGMTLSICKNDISRSDLGQLFHGMVSNEDITETKDNEIDDPVVVGKIHRLFDLWDVDHSGQLDLEEIMMGLGKFNQTKDVEITLDDTVKAIRSFDDNGDAKLDRVEFGHMLSLFATKTKIPLHELIDFMVVTSALKDNDEGMMSYIASVKARATDQVRRDQSQKRGFKQRDFSIATFWR